jgi:hypothetical protein
MTEESKPGKGGARPGAGRPRLDKTKIGEPSKDPTITMLVRLRRSYRSRLEAEAKRQGTTASELIRRWIDAYCPRDKTS